jgi:hypothetical protein
MDIIRSLPLAETSVHFHLDDLTVQSLCINGTARALKIINDCMNKNIYFYLETFDGLSYYLYLYVAHFFNTSLN